MNNTAITAPLSSGERDTLHDYEAYLDQHLSIFFEVGRILVTIRHEKLYREDYPTFEAYCDERWQISRSRAYQLMDASAIQEDLSTDCGHETPLPINEAQTRALKAAPPEKRGEAWRTAVASADGKQPTAPQIKAAVNDVVKSSTCETCGNPFAPPAFEPDATQCGKCLAQAAIARGKARSAQERAETVGNCYRTRQGFIIKVTEVNEEFGTVEGTFYSGVEEVRAPFVLSDLSYELSESNWTREQADWKKTKTADRQYVGMPYHVLCCDECKLFGPAQEMQPWNGHRLCPKCHRQKMLPSPKPGEIKAVVKDFILDRHNGDGNEFDTLTRLCNGEERELYDELFAHCKSRFLISVPQCVPGACDEALADWKELQAERARHQTVIAEHEALNLQSSDRDKIMRAGLKLYRAEAHTKLLKIYTRVSDPSDGMLRGSWKTHERFDTKTALKARIYELEHEPDVIFDGRI